MDLDNQSSATTTTNADSAANDFGAPVSFDNSTIDMGAINEAVAAADDSGSNMHNTFDVGDISLNDVPSSQDELDRRIKENPDLNLAGGPVDPAAASAMGAAEAPKAAAPSASFVSGDIVDATDEPSPAEEVHKQYDNINADPLANFEAAPAQSAAEAQQGPSAAAPTSEQPAPAAPTEQSTPAANAVSAPARKSKTPLIIGICIAIVAIVVGAVIFLVVKK